jgi:hypothetical protein
MMAATIALPCPCGTSLLPRRWRRGSKTNLYSLRCPMCGRRGSPAVADLAKLVPTWNDTVRAEQAAQRRGIA